MSTQSILKAVEAHDPTAAALSEILSINSALSDLQGRVSRLAQQMATRQVFVSDVANFNEIMAAVADAMEPEPNPPSSSNRDVSTDGEASSGAAPQGEAPHAGIGSEMLADHEEHSAKGAGEADASAAEIRSNPAPTIPLKPYVPASPACQKVLDLYGETTLTAAEISRQLDMNRSSVGSYLAMGRKAGDPRVVKGDAARRSDAPAGDQPEEMKAENIVETVIVQVDDPSEPAAPPAEAQTIQAGLSSLRIFRRPSKPVDEDEGPSRLRIPSVPAPAPKAKPVEAPADEPKGAQVEGFDADKIMVVDVEALKIHGPWGSVDVVRPFARSMERMVDGGTYDVDTLRDLGPWPRTDALKEHFSGMRRKLAAIGIDLVTVNKFMYRVQRLEA